MTLTLIFIASLKPIIAESRKFCGSCFHPYLCRCRTGMVIFMETSLVKSVFKSGESTTSKEVFTKIWIELINKLERSKSVSFCVKNDDK